MKMIFRYMNAAAIAAVFALGAVAVSAQDPCTDAEGQAKARDDFNVIFKDKSLDGLKKRIEAAKAGSEKYGKCESYSDMAAYFETNIPKWENDYKVRSDAEEEAKLTSRFDAALKAKNWDDVFASGKEILNRFPEKYRTVEVVLGAVAGEEAFKSNFKYSDDGLRFLKMSIADIEVGKSFKLGDKDRFGLSEKDKATGKVLYNFEFANRDEALGWLNLYAGYITAIGKKDKLGALPFLYKTTQSKGEVAKNATPYDLIGSYYFDELNKIVEQIQTKSKAQSDTDTPEVAQQKIDELKKLVAQSNGTAERAMDAYSRAYNLADGVKAADYKARMKKNVADAYQLRFGKAEGVDGWIASAVAKPFVNPTTPIQPISDADPATTTTSQN